MLLAAPGTVPSAPLFESQDALDVVIEAPLGDLSSKRHAEPEFPGTISYVDMAGADRTLAVTMSTRGKTRLEICAYPPLSLTFDPTETAGTLFEGQRKLKMVRPCKRSKAANDWVYLELGAYRAYNVITDTSFRARQLNVTFRDTESFFSNVREQPAFLLEDDSDVAKRRNRVRIRPPRIEPAQMALGETTHYMLFQYLIGNTDFSVKAGPKGEGCCHNGRVIAEPGRQREWIIVPYDFDYAGIIDTDYAAPHEKLPIKRVTTRLYRGFCWQNDVIPESIALFNLKRVDIEAALIPPEVSKGKARRAKRYIDRFYSIINDPQERQENLFDKCRGPDSLPVRERTMSPQNTRER